MRAQIPNRLHEAMALIGVVLALACSANAATRPGVIRVDVDATQAPQRLLHTHLAMPVTPGPLVLLFPQWIPWRAHARRARSTISPG